MSDPVTEWLKGLGLDQYASTFEKNAVEFDLLPELSETDLKEMGVDALGHRKKILKAISALQPEYPTALHPADKPATQETSPQTANDEDINTWSRTPGERKPVTMLFADIVGSTALTEKLDAEDAHDLLYRATQRMCQAVENNEGTVCRFMGDGIMAMFGAPVSSERHALEGCRAALDMQGGIQKYAAEIESSHGASLQIRVGLHSGEVVVLEVGDDPGKPEYDASGPTVPLAARMEQSAAPGTILMTQATWALAGARIDTTEQHAIRVKGVSEPVIAYQLNKALSATESSGISSRKPIVGRKSELAQFRGLLEACLDSGHGQTILVRGEAGIGKSRLVEEMTRLARASGLLNHKALVLDFGAGKGQEAVPSLVRSFLGITQGSNKRERESALDQAEADAIVDSENRVFLNDLLDLTQPLRLRTLYDAMDQRARKEGKRIAVVEMLGKLAARNPVFVVIEDLHWADSITLDYLAGLAAAVADCPALMVLTSRGEGDPLDTTWRARTGEAPIVTWDLSPLRKEESIMLVSTFIDASDSLAIRCIERAAGNPLFLEQLLLSVEKDVTESVPDSIKSLVLSRMDQLSKEDKTALQAASVLGQRFDLDGLRFLVEQPAYQCGELVERHLVRPEGALLLFAHALIQEGAYASLLKRQRTLLHLRAAEWYSSRDSQLHAEHLDQAGDAGAPKAYLDAATEQAKLYRPERALQLIRRGLQIAADYERFALCCLEGELLRTLGLTSESIEVYRHASELAGNEVEHCSALVGLAEGLVLIETHDELLNVLDDADKLASAHNLLRELAVINQLRGGVYFFRSMYAACLEASTTSLQAARDADSPELEARALSGLADAEYSRGRFISARGYFNQCIELARKHGYGRVLAANLTMRGYLYWHHNDLESAVVDLHEAIELAVKTRHARAEMVVTAVYADILFELGNLDESEQYAQRAMTISQQLGSKLFEAECYGKISQLELNRGNHVEAYQQAQQALEILRASESGMAFWGPCALADLAQATRDADERRAILNEAEALLKDDSVSHNHIIFYTNAMELCLRTAAWEEVERYARALQDYTAVEPLPRCDFFIARGIALAAFGRGNRDQETMENIRCLHDEAKRIGLKSAIPAMATALQSN